MKDVVLITGPAGFIGFKTVLTALEAGYNVRAVIRKPEQAEKLKSHVKIAPHAERLEFAVIKDLTAPGVFDAVLSDVAYVLHIASPLPIETDDFERDIINPAIDMSTSLLYSATKVPTIKRIIITSSMVSMIPFEKLTTPDERLYTARDINANPSRSVAHGLEAYWNSKAFSRIAISEFLEKYKPHFDVLQLMPGAVVGVDDRAQSIEDLVKSYPDWSLRMSPVLGTKQTFPLSDVPVDVADVARAHVDAINPSVPGNTDYILCTGSPDGLKWDDSIEVAKRHYPDRVGSKELPLGGTLPTSRWAADYQETERAFGWKFTTFEDSMKDMIGQYLELIDAEAKAPAA
ncbi:putative 3-beta hydroxysteroid dehydrogenase/isomerase [Aaosphaeria arxii CBS 175.79]|uniref:Putative 3-beta hydroxysteroid dehydrogenase/isomerase n=1 Tax=Aaosphaeria arxii CBS 175.79 TaxID=1450172 RepID=A0A6A5XS76_9PLEO|nr:putative 3-beta hydroxysteroid dehydrogenase/isomerase [Aaosphaeria arxii CBS 175.79]KAF2015550.1 putative 3-beta hydroxysteroid dehydrogenase/isomerase [Aaosphaeria arxii CBS 175.79]